MGADELGAKAREAIARFTAEHGARPGPSARLLVSPLDHRSLSMLVHDGKPVFASARNMLFDGVKVEADRATPEGHVCLRWSVEV